MSHAYQEVNTGQVVISDEPREDLEELARWESIPVPEGAPEDHAGSQPPTDPPNTPSEDWTHEQLDELAASRDIKFPANTNKAAKVAALAAPPAE